MAKKQEKVVEFEGVKVKLTPMMEQYLEAKRLQPDGLLFFRMGDFYELFFEDARQVHQALGLTLTSRNKGDAEEVPMAGVPVRAVEGYLSQLVEQGHRVVVCDQLEDPSKGAGIVRRGITRVVTPGTLLDEEEGDASPRVLVAIATQSRKKGGVEDEIGLASLELATGAFRVTEVHGLEGLSSELRRIHPKEVLLRDEDRALFSAAFGLLPDTHLQLLDGARFDPKALVQEAEAGPRELGDYSDEAVYLTPEEIGGFFKRTKSFGFKRSQVTLEAIAGVLSYIFEVQRGVARHIQEVVPYRVADYMVIDEATMANLEIVETIRGGQRKGSLLGEIDETLSSGGRRRLRSWLSYPLLGREAIESRHLAVEELVKGFALRDGLRNELRSIDDIERLSGRLATGRTTPRDLVALGTSLSTVPSLQEQLSQVSSDLLQELILGLDPCEDLVDLIARAIVDEPPISLAEGGVIREGFNEEFDRTVELARSGKSWLLDFETEQRKESGISSLKVKYNKVFGYFIEVTKANLHLVPEHYIRRQTLTNSERFVTPELQEYEEQVLGAEERRYELERTLFEQVRAQALTHLGRLRRTASNISSLDVLASLAELAHQRDYCRPILDDEAVLVVKEGRHPVVERFMQDERFVPNDLHLDDQARLQIITGPNMAGKSTLIRQAAIITLLAQAGSFVPAEYARIGLVDRIFSRVGASDNLARGQSTFMVEMAETANILKHATSRSLIILDEIGRGTATYDGLSIAWAVAEHLHDAIGARVLFATHYHELTELSRTHEGVVNYSVAVKEWQGDIIFLRKLVKGAASRSYGIQVARLAGIPQGVIERSEEILYNLEMNAHDERGRPTFARHVNEDSEPEPADKGGGQLSLFGGAPAPAPPVDPKLQGLVQELRRLKLDATTPIQALNLLYKWQRFL